MQDDTTNIEDTEELIYEVVDILDETEASNNQLPLKPKPPRPNAKPDLSLRKPKILSKPQYNLKNNKKHALAGLLVNLQDISELYKYKLPMVCEVEVGYFYNEEIDFERGDQFVIAGAVTEDFAICKLKDEKTAEVKVKSFSASLVNKNPQFDSKSIYSLKNIAQFNPLPEKIVSTQEFTFESVKIAVGDIQEVVKLTFDDNTSIRKLKITTPSGEEVFLPLTLKYMFDCHYVMPAFDLETIIAEVTLPVRVYLTDCDHGWMGEYCTLTKSVSKDLIIVYNYDRKNKEHIDVVCELRTDISMEFKVLDQSIQVLPISEIYANAAKVIQMKKNVYSNPIMESSFLESEAKDIKNVQRLRRSKSLTVRKQCKFNLNDEFPLPPSLVEINKMFTTNEQSLKQKPKQIHDSKIPSDNTNTRRKRSQSLDESIYELFDTSLTPKENIQPIEPITLDSIFSNNNQEKKIDNSQKRKNKHGLKMFSPTVPSSKEQITTTNHISNTTNSPNSSLKTFTTYLSFDKIDISHHFQKKDKQQGIKSSKPVSVSEITTHSLPQTSNKDETCDEKDKVIEKLQEAYEKECKEKQNLLDQVEILKEKLEEYQNRLKLKDNEIRKLRVASRAISNVQNEIIDESWTTANINKVNDFKYNYVTMNEDDTILESKPLDQSILDKVRAYSTQQVCELLEKLKLENYKEQFTQNNINGELFLEVTEDILEHELGIVSKLHRKKIIIIVKKVLNNESINIVV